MKLNRLFKSFLLCFSICLLCMHIQVNINAKSWTFNIQGKITNSTNGDISNAYVDIETKQGSFKYRAQVQSDGTFKFENITLFDNEVNLIVYKNYYHKEIRNITLNKNDITVEPIDLKPTVLEFKFHVKNKDLDNYGYILSLLNTGTGTRIYEVKEPGKTLHFKVNEADIGGFNSTILLTGQAQGYYINQAYDKPLSANYNHEDYFIEETVEFRKAPYDITGKYVDENEKPVNNMEVLIKDRNENIINKVKTDKNGNFTVKDLGIYIAYHIIPDKEYYKASSFGFIKTTSDNTTKNLGNIKLEPVKTTINLSLKDNIKDLSSLHVKLVNNHSTLIELNKNNLNQSVVLNTKDLDTNHDGLIDSNIQLIGSLDGYEFNDAFNRKILSKTEDNTVNISVKFTNKKEDSKNEDTDEEIIQEETENKTDDEVISDKGHSDKLDKETSKTNNKKTENSGFNWILPCGIGSIIIFFFIIILWKRKKDDEDEENEESEK